MNRKAVLSVAATFVLLLSSLLSFGFIPSVSSNPGSDWPMFRHNINHTGYTPDLGPTVGSVIWTYETGDVIAMSSPSVVGGVVYIGSKDGNVYALNATTGAKIWNYSTRDFIDSSPSVVGGVVYIGAGSHGSTSGNIYALNATTGAKIWNYSTGGGVPSSPSVVGGVVYIGSLDKNIYALNATTETLTREQRLIWKYSTTGAVDASPTVVGGRVYVGEREPGNKLYCLNATTETLTDAQRSLWNYTVTGRTDWCAPAFVDGVIYIGDVAGFVHALNATDKSVKWKVQPGDPQFGWITSSVAVADGVVYVGTWDHKVYALYATNGSTIWNYATADLVSTSPAVVSNGIVYVGCGFTATTPRAVYALNTTNGNNIWMYTTGGAICSSPAVVDGVVYVGSGDKKVYALGVPPPRPNLAINLYGDLVASPTGVIVGESIVFTVTVRNIGGAGTAENFKVSVYYDGTYLIGEQTVTGGLANGSSTTVVIPWVTTGVLVGPHWIRAVVSNVTGDPPADNVNEGLVAANVVLPPAVSVQYPWPMFSHDPDRTGYTTAPGHPTTNRTIWIYRTGDAVSSSPAVVDGIVYVGSEDNKVYALNATTGAKIWNYTTGDEVSSSPAVVDGVVYVGSGDKNVYALNATTGVKIWNYTNWGGTPAVVGGVVYVGSLDNNVYALNATTEALTPAQRLIWNYTTGDWVGTPAVVGGVVYVGSRDNRTYALNATTEALTAAQRLIWNYTLIGSVGSVAVVGGVVYVGCIPTPMVANASVTGMYALNATTEALTAAQRLIWNYTLKEYGMATSPAVVGGIVYIGTWDNRTYALNATNGVQIWNYTTTDTGSSPAVVNGVVYIGSSGDTVTSPILYALNATTGASIWNHTMGASVDSSPAVVDNIVYVGSRDGGVYAIGGRVPNVSVTNIILLPLWPYGASVVYPSGNWKVSINVTVWNWGTQSETFQVYSYYDGGFMKYGPPWITLTLAPGATTNVTITWKTRGVPHCTYNATTTSYMPYKISASATNAPRFSKETIVVRATGDANGKLPVNVVDLGMLGVAWLNTPYDPRCDFNCDGNINVVDLGLLGVWWLYPD